jgi:hypothetical protein
MRGAAVTARRQRRHRESGHLGPVRLVAGHLPAPGPVIWADSTAGTASPQLLYQAISGSNLRAYADTDAVGHAALGN